MGRSDFDSGSLIYGPDSDFQGGPFSAGLWF
jgi:hypothetical protein